MILSTNKGPVRYLNRSKKARMIEAFLEDGVGTPIEGYSILDVGCGNGQIGDHFAGRNDVSAVDVEDVRDNKNSTVKFNQTTDEKLPFDDGVFDIVISHHVIEHVENQNVHLAELRRVLKTKGIIYLGCPNRGSPFMAGHIGNTKVLNLPGMTSLFAYHGFSIEECYTRFLKYPNRYHCNLSLGRYFPKWFLNMFRRWYPSQCFLLRVEDERINTPT